MGAIRDYVNAITMASTYVQALDSGQRSLDSLIAVRQQVVDGLAEIQASNAYTAAQKADAQAEAVELRDAIQAFAESL